MVSFHYFFAVIGFKTRYLTQPTFPPFVGFVFLCQFWVFRWPEVISNEELWARASQGKIEKRIRRRKWSGQGTHAGNHKDSVTAAGTLSGLPGGKRKRRPSPPQKNTWGRSAENETPMIEDDSRKLWMLYEGLWEKCIMGKMRAESNEDGGVRSSRKQTFFLMAISIFSSTLYVLPEW